MRATGQSSPVDREGVNVERMKNSRHDNSTPMSRATGKGLTLPGSRIVRHAPPPGKVMAGAVVRAVVYDQNVCRLGRRVPLHRVERRPEEVDTIPVHDHDRRTGSHPTSAQPQPGERGERPLNQAVLNHELIGGVSHRHVAIVAGAIRTDVFWAPLWRFPGISTPRTRRDRRIALARGSFGGGDVRGDARAPVAGGTTCSA